MQIAAAILGSLFLMASISWLVWSSFSPSARWQRQDLLFQICYGMYGFMDVVCIGEVLDFTLVHYSYYLLLFIIILLWRSVCILRLRMILSVFSLVTLFQVHYVFNRQSKHNVKDAGCAQIIMNAMNSLNYWKSIQQIHTNYFMSTFSVWCLATLCWVIICITHRIFVIFTTVTI